MSALSSFILLFLLPIITGIIIVIANFSRPKDKQQGDLRRVIAIQNAKRQVVGSKDDWRQEPWRAFAEANGLTLAHAAALSNDIRISGEYRGHHLALEIRVVSDMRTDNSTTIIRAVLNAYTSEKRTEALMHKLAEPTPPNVLNVLTGSGFAFLPGTLAAGDGGKRLSYEESGFGQESDKLKRISDVLGDLAEGYPAIVAAGGAVAPALQILVKEDDLLRGVIIEILKDIAQATQYLAGQAGQLLCSRCLVHCGPHRADLPWQPDVTYYGCRACHQSQEFIDCPKGVVAVLDAAWQGAQERQGSLLRVNWLARRALFDFDRVEIIRATDKDVEHFAMQVGNDTDPFRKPRYAQMRCSLAPNYHPAKNTLRILESLFGRVDA